MGEVYGKRVRLSTLRDHILGTFTWRPLVTVKARREMLVSRQFEPKDRGTPEEKLDWRE